MAEKTLSKQPSIKHVVAGFFALLAVIPLPCIAAPPSGEKTEIRRWAILTSPSCPKQLAELVFANLISQDLDLVERGELLEVLAAEQLLNKPTTAAQNIGVGKLVKADAIVFIDYRGDQEIKLTKVTCLATKQGVRIGSASFSGDLQQTPKAIANFIEEMRQRFATGIETVVAVPPFVSENVSYEFDGLQTAIAELVTQRLIQNPGVAVVEIDQATKLLKELALSGIENHQQDIVEVRGKFKVDPLEPTQISITAEILGNDSQKTSSSSLPRSEVVKWIDTELVPSILLDDAKQAASNRQPLPSSPDFFERANTFASQGDLLRSTQLREAGLVSDFRNATQRKLLAKEYWYLLQRNSAYSGAVFRDGVFCDRELIESHRDKVRPALTAFEIFGTRHLHHIEWLLRTNNIGDEVEFRQLVRDCVSGSYFHTDNYLTRYLSVSRLVGKKHATIDSTSTDTQKVRQLQFRGLADREDWWITSSRRINDEFWKSQNEDCLLTHASIIDSYPMNKQPAVGLLLRFPTSFQFSTARRERTKIWKWQDFRDQEIARIRNQIDLGAIERYQQVLAQSPSHLGQLCATHCQIQLLTFKLSSKNAASDSIARSTDDLRSSVRRLLEQANRLRSNLEETNSRDTYSSSYRAFWSQLDKTLKDASSFVELPDNYVAFAIKNVAPRQATSNTPQPTKRGWGKLKLSELAISVSERSPAPAIASYAPGIVNVTDCGNFDVFWSSKTVYIMKQKGILERLPIENWYSKPQTIASIHWDGRFVWLSGATNRVLVLDPETWKIHEIKNLPAHDHIYACPLRKGTAVLVANVMPGYRAWCANVSINMRKLDSESFQYKTNIIHEAKKVRRRGSEQVPFHSLLEFGFRSDWTHAWRIDSERFLALTQHSGRLLTIDEAQGLELHPLPMTSPYDQPNVIATSGERAYVLHGKKLISLNRSLSKTGEIDLGKYFRQVVFHSNWLYLFGGDSRWIRVDRNFTTVEPLIEGRLPAGYHDCKLGISHHYGLVAFGDSLANEEVPKIFSLAVEGDAAAPE